MRMAGSRPHHVKAEQVLVHQCQYRLQVTQRGHATDREAGCGLDKGSVGAPECADLGFHFFLVHTAVATGDYQHCGGVLQAPENNAFGNLSELHTQRLRGLARRACGLRQHHGRMRVAVFLQCVRNALYAVRPGLLGQ